MITGFVLQPKGKIVLQTVGLYCNRRGLEGGSSVLQYTALYCNLKGYARLDCIAIQCPAKPRYGQGVRNCGRWGAQAWALGCARREARGWACWARRQALGRGRWGGRNAGVRAGVRARASVKARASVRARAGAWARADAQAAGAQGRSGRAAVRRWERAGWLWAVHSVHTACFWPG